MLYLPKELNAWCLVKSLELKISVYDLFKGAIYNYARDNGFTHDHIFRNKWLTNKEGHKQEFLVCKICGERG